MKALLSATAVISLLAAHPVAAQCVGYQGYGISSASTIGVRVGTGWTTAPPIGSAISMWNNGCPNMMGSEMPSFLNNSSGNINIYVSRLSGNNPKPGGGCAKFNHQLGSNNEVVGGTIAVYDKTNAGADCMWVLPHVTLDNLIAHELGHVLGLSNSPTGASCNSYIMGDNWPSASVNGAECTAVDERWNQPNEEPPPPPTEEIQHNGSPIVLDLGNDGYRLTSVAEGVQFDLTNQGHASQTAWTRAEAENAFLAMDRNGNGRIDQGAELFGDFTPLPSGQNAPNGFVALAVLDENGDGLIDEADPVWPALLLWTDRDHDGRSTPAELEPIAQSSVAAVETAYHEIGRKDRWGNEFRYQGRFLLRHGLSVVRRPCYDVFFRLE